MGGTLFFFFSLLFFQSKEAVFVFEIGLYLLSF